MYSSGVQSDEPVSIETENINIEVVNITQTDEEYLYKPALETDNKVVPVTLHFYRFMHSLDRLYSAIEQSFMGDSGYGPPPPEKSQNYRVS